MPSEKSTRVVFVGNIPYGKFHSCNSPATKLTLPGLTEEQVVEIFSTVGKVLNFRLVHDRETGRPKGFGFAEFQDADSAASAVRNLNDYDIMNRKLRVDYSHDGGEEDATPAGYQAQPQLPPNGSSLPVPTASSLPPLPPGADLAPNISCPDAISRTLGTLPASQLLDIISQMKSLVMAEPSKALELLNQAPQLSYAIFQALLLMGLVETSALQNVVEQSGQQPPVQQQAIPPSQQPYQPYPLNAGGMAVSTPPIPANFRAPVPPPPIAQPAPSLDSAQLIQQVMSLTPQMINAMPEPERSQIIALQQQFMSAGVGH